MPTQADWKRYLDEQVKTTAEAQRSINEAYLRQAAVNSDLLTGHPAWDTYLQRLQVELESAQIGLTHWQEKVCEAQSSDELRTVQIQIIISTTRIEVLRYCMSLPKEILAHAHDTLDKSRQ